MITLALLTLTTVAAAAPPRIGDPAPAIDLPSLDGGALIARDRLQGRVTVVEFFATWCVPCAHSLDDLLALRTQLGDAVNLLIVAAGDADSNKVRAHFGQHPLPRGTMVALDPQRVVARRWGQDRFPTSFFVDPVGVIRHINRGHGPGFRARADRWLRTMLPPPAPSRPPPGR